MPIEFVVTLNYHHEYTKKLELPDVFLREAFNRSRNVYVSGIRGIRKKVTLVVPKNVHAEIRGEKWKEFVEDNMDMDVNVLHFVQEGDDTFYLTGYNHMGKEIGGYEDTIIGDFLPELGQEADIQIMCEGNQFDVHVNRVEPGSYGVESEYLLNADNWHALQTIPADFLVYHPMNMYTHVLMKHQNVEYTMTVKMEYHKEDPDRINHKNVFGEWREFAGQCRFDYEKMIRFKYMYLLNDLDGPAMGQMPVFHVC